SAIELFDGVAIDQTRRAPGFAHRLGFIEGEPGGVLIVEYSSDNADGKADIELRSCVDRLKEVLAKAGQGYAVVPVADTEGMANVWYVRKEGLGLIMGVKGDYKPVAVIEDASVPVEHLADYIEDLDAMMQALDTKTVYYAHASAGTLHVRPFLNTKEAAGVEKLREISVGSMELVKKYGGAVSSEHGDGIVRGWLNEQFLGPELCDVYRRLKGIFDPNGLLNPGKILDTPPMTESLRFDPAYETIPILEEMDWSEDGGFARSVELCNGNGACRQLQSGTMCPSFMVTRDEKDSTRGRANALRAALSGELPPEAFTSRDLYDVMDLCVQCKACKTECPSNVDMAKMKTEWLSKYWEANGLPRRTRLFAHQPMLARRLNGGFLARVANWGSSLRFVQKRLGISTRRMPPPFAAEPFTKWFARHNWESDGPEVVLYADTFSNYNHPEIARAAAEFLHRTGHRVIVPNAEACCGRPLLSKGLVAEAQEMALKTLALLLPYADKGWPIVGLEPSCILTFSDEFLTLLPGDPHARTLADASMTFEEFVERRAGEGAFEEIRWKEQPKQVLLHGHCHQKALVGTGFAERSLALAGHSVTTVDSGCCGMAGAFGYEAEHYDISIKMAERVLAPAVRKAAEDTIIAAAGTSCREQIKDTTGRRALHPAEILRDALDQ
ncbi:MAG: FAD-linked oxidase C-terminal domain-containing protein, partial [Saprospiraceae bacterium]|nr:FAD-linked oxidase C-terminal domain-containing protein [Saprospiraceae bacterium]